MCMSPIAFLLFGNQPATYTYLLTLLLHILRRKFKIGVKLAYFIFFGPPSFLVSRGRGLLWRDFVKRNVILMSIV